MREALGRHRLAGLVEQLEARHRHVQRAGGGRVHVVGVAQADDHRPSDDPVREQHHRRCRVVAVEADQPLDAGLAVVRVGHDLAGGRHLAEGIAGGAREVSDAQRVDAVGQHGAEAPADMRRRPEQRCRLVDSVEQLSDTVRAEEDRAGDAEDFHHRRGREAGLGHAAGGRDLVEVGPPRLLRRPDDDAATGSTVCTSPSHAG